MFMDNGNSFDKKTNRFLIKAYLYVCTLLFSHLTAVTFKVIKTSDKRSKEGDELKIV